MPNSPVVPLLLVSIYLGIVWLVSVILTVWDKHQARRRRWRVPERVLLLWGLLGGALPMYLTMKGIRHKTRHKKFMFGLPAIFLVQLLLMGFTAWLRFRGVL